MTASASLHKLAGRRRKGNKRLRMILLIDLLLLLCVICLGIIFRMAEADAFTLELIGDQEITLGVDAEFEDPGVNTDKASVIGSVDTAMPGDYTITYSYRDQSITRTVHVVGKGDIVIGLRGSAVQLVKAGDKYIENGAYATDTGEGGGVVPSDAIEVTGDVDTGTPGDYDVTYTASYNGSVAEKVRTVRVLSEEDYGDACEYVPVLMYHWVYSEESVPDKLTGNWIEDVVLSDQLSYLKDNNYYYPGWKEFRAWLDGEISLPVHSTILTFNDGKKDFFKYGLPLLEQYEIPATVFMNCWSKNDAAGKITRYASEYLDFESQSYAMHQAGHTGGYKGIMPSMSKDEIRDDLSKAIDVVGSNEAFAYPYGEYTQDCIDTVQELGYGCAFTANYGRVYRNMDPYKLPRTRVSGEESFEIWRDSVH